MLSCLFYCWHVSLFLNTIFYLKTEPSTFPGEHRMVGQEATAWDSTASLPEVATREAEPWESWAMFVFQAAQLVHCGHWSRARFVSCQLQEYNFCTISAGRRRQPGWFSGISEANEGIRFLQEPLTGKKVSIGQSALEWLSFPHTFVTSLNQTPEEWLGANF